MVPGSDDIIGCPSCRAPHRRGSLMSGNTVGARWWSDGKREAPMLPSSPLVTRCRGCGQYFWLHRGERLGRISGLQSDTSRDVVLVDVGPRPVEVHGILRRVLGEEAPEGKALHVPLELARDIPWGKAKALIEELQAAGATARVRPVWEPPARPWVNYLLTAVGPRRVEVMALLREQFRVSLAEVKELLERLPLQLLRPELYRDLPTFIARYRAAGATVTEQEMRPREEEPLPGEAFPPEWLELPGVAELAEEELLAALAAGVARGREEERELRLRAWWAGNDPYREPGAAWKPFSERAPAARENLRALLKLLDPEEPLEGLLKAEALRELEHFDEARALLAWVPSPEELRKVGEQLRVLAEQRVPEVRVTIGS
ncbi:MAG TPA: hypothetical protein VF794_25525 [Archangium sp.]|uniref:hypothetical protein n=1 Tax=Archangium sp. TaxID=1872627 RepID=UPI002ED87D68